MAERERENIYFSKNIYNVKILAFICNCQINQYYNKINIAV